MPTFDTLLRDLRGQTPEIDVTQLNAELQTGNRPTLIDVREADEHSQGIIPSAIHIPRGFLELRIEKQIFDRAAPLVLYCAGGTRSLLATRSLIELGYTNVKSLAGGFSGWKKAGLAWEQPVSLRPD